MFEFIRGVLKEVSLEEAVLDVQGVGYKISIPASAFSKMPPTGKDLLLYTTFVVRETAHTLHGFLSKKERDFFELLMSVSGVGPKLAMAILGHMTLQELIASVTQEDAKSIKVPGVGKKTAERLVLELKDKLQARGFLEGEKERKFAPSLKLRDAVSALVNLGYTENSANKAVSNVIGEGSEDDFELSQLIAAALKRS